MAKATVWLSSLIYISYIQTLNALKSRKLASSIQGQMAPEQQTKWSTLDVQVHASECTSNLCDSVHFNYGIIHNTIYTLTKILHFGYVCQGLPKQFNLSDCGVVICKVYINYALLQ